MKLLTSSISLLKAWRAFTTAKFLVCAWLGGPDTWMASLPVKTFGEEVRGKEGGKGERGKQREEGERRKKQGKNEVMERNRGGR